MGTLRGTQSHCRGCMPGTQFEDTVCIGRLGSQRDAAIGGFAISRRGSLGVKADTSTPESLWTNADDRLPVASLGRVESRNGIVEGRDVADVRPQSSVPHPLDDLRQLATIGLDNEVDRQAVRGPGLGRADDGASVPPARIRPADRFWMSPPMTSKTTSTPPTACGVSLSRSMNS